jgi:glycerol-3-phosphate acyltransferase PlsX
VTLTLDAEGGDYAPQEVIAGALAVASPTLRVLLVGRPEAVEPDLRAAEAHPGRPYIEVIPSGSVITFHDEPARALRSQPDSSIAVGARTVAEGRSQGFISAGNTGAMTAAGLLIVKRVPGVKRPAILAVLPGMEGPVAFLDAGANADCKPEYLLEFAIMGSVFCRRVLGVDRPRVALLNIGEEESKGSNLAKEAYGLLAQANLDFVGNVEGRALLFNAADVVVTDGFTGNVALKLLEGTASSLLLRIRSAAARDSRAKLGGLLLRPALRELRTILDPEEYGGTYLLGVRGLVVICHGNSSRKAIANALKFAGEAVRQGVVQEVDDELSRILGRMARPDDPVESDLEKER